MRAPEILHDELAEAMGFMHKARWKALWLTVVALLRGKQLWLTAMGRSRPDGAAPKHSIKAVDRLLGNPGLYAERKRVYAVLAQRLLRKRSRPVVLVDATEVSTGYALTASIACDGRAFPIYALPTPHSKPKAAVFRRFLRDLAEILPGDCRPILVTDAGFETPWLEAVEAMHWDYVGRRGNCTKFLVGGRWVTCEALYKRATRRAKNLGASPFPKRGVPRPRRLVLSKQPTTGHRQRLTRSGTPGQRKDDHRQQKRANEPWLLATSLTCRPAQVVALYALRMQIEESFRDAKNHRWGWSLRDCRTRSTARLELLLLIAAIAYFVQQTIGLAGERLNLHHRHQANTLRSRRVLSFFVLGGLLLHSDDGGLISVSALRTAITALRKKIHSLTEFLR